MIKTEECKNWKTCLSKTGCHGNVNVVDHMMRVKIFPEDLKLYIFKVGAGLKRGGGPQNPPPPPPV